VHARSLPVSQQRVGRLPDPVVLELVLDAQLLQLVVVVDVMILDQPVGAADGKKDALLDGLAERAGDGAGRHVHGPGQGRQIEAAA
jgi:hypothetical protein